MTIIKEFVHTTSGPLIILRTRTYSDSLQYFDGLYQVALQDFPGVERSSVIVVQYGGERYKRTFGIEFLVPAGTVVPTEYQERQHTEVKL